MLLEAQKSLPSPIGYILASMQGAAPSCTEITLADHVPDPAKEEVSELTISAERGVILTKV